MKIAKQSPPLSKTGTKSAKDFNSRLHLQPPVKSSERIGRLGSTAIDELTDRSLSSSQRLDKPPFLSRKIQLKILIIDDHVLFREGVALLLQNIFDAPTVLEAGRCSQATDLIDREQDVTLILMDLDLPDISGLQGILDLKASHPEIPVVALSSSDDRETVMKALEAGAMGYIPKSSSSAVLSAALRLIMAHGIYLPASVLLGQSNTEATTLAHPSAGTSTSTGVRRSPRDFGMTARQADVLYLILQGKPAKIISRELGLSPSTVKAHTSAVLRSLNVTTRTQAVIEASRLGMVFPATN